MKYYGAIFRAQLLSLHKQSQRTVCMNYKVKTSQENDICSFRCFNGKSPAGKVSLNYDK